MLVIDSFSHHSLSLYGWRLDVLQHFDSCVLKWHEDEYMKKKHFCVNFTFESCKFKTTHGFHQDITGVCEIRSETCNIPYRKKQALLEKTLKTKPVNRVEYNIQLGLYMFGPRQIFLHLYVWERHSQAACWENVKSWRMFIHFPS